MGVDGTRPRIAWFSCLNCGPVGESRSAYLTDVLLSELCSKYEIELFHNSFQNYSGLPTYHYLTAVERHRRCPYDLFFYQLEDAPFSYFTRLHLGLMPGVVMFHDFVLRDFGPEPILNSTWESVLRKFAERDSAWPNRLAEHTQRGPHAVREAGWSVLPVFLSEKDHDEFRRLVTLRIGSAMPSYYLPYPVKVASRDSGKRVVGTFRIAYTGRPGPEDRAPQVLAALGGIEARVALVWLVRDSQEEVICRELLSEHRNLEVTFEQQRSPAKWREVTSECHAALHPYFSAYGQVGPYLHISMAAGVPCVASDFAQADYLPDSTVLKVRPGLGEVGELREAIVWLMEHESGELGSRSRSYAAEHFDHRTVAQELDMIFRTALDGWCALETRWKNFELSARQAVMQEIAGLSPADPLMPDLCGQVFKEMGWQ